MPLASTRRGCGYTPPASSATTESIPVHLSKPLISRLITITCTTVVFTVFGDLHSVAAQPEVANPHWPARCPLRLGLVIDQSSSMAPRFDDVRTAARNVVDSLRDKKSAVSIIGFGTDAEVISQDVDVSDDDARHELKDQIDALDAHEGDASATNWEAALIAARSLHLHVVILMTDGLPNVYGNPAQEGSEAVTAAATAANQLKSGGTRIAAVGIDLAPGGEGNLRIITGPDRGNDYFVTDTSGLLHQLYVIVARSCDVPITRLPKPEPPDFPWLPTILGALAGLALLTFIAFLLRRRGAAAGPRAPARAGRGVVADQRIDHSHLTKQLRGNKNPPSTKDQP